MNFLLARFELHCFLFGLFTLEPQNVDPEDLWTGILDTPTLLRPEPGAHYGYLIMEL
jgi:hypothetical protein